jgi:hypothetical protein
VLQEKHVIEMERKLAMPDTVFGVDFTFGEKEKVVISNGIVGLYLCEAIQRLHKDRHKRDPASMMRDLKIDISETGRLMDPSAWGVPGKDSPGEDTTFGRRVSCTRICFFSSVAITTNHHDENRPRV